jgi:hypothetical protein
MDKRQTFADSTELLSILSGFYEDKQNVALLVDIDGLTRMEGRITAINQNGDLNKTIIIVDDKDGTLLNEIVAVNGIFSSDYSEC